jgi:hypothetical protein
LHMYSPPPSDLRALICLPVSFSIWDLKILTELDQIYAT